MNEKQLLLLSKESNEDKENINPQMNCRKFTDSLIRDLDLKIAILDRS